MLIIIRATGTNVSSVQRSALTLYLTHAIKGRTMASKINDNEDLLFYITEHIENGGCDEELLIMMHDPDFAKYTIADMKCYLIEKIFNKATALIAEARAEMIEEELPSRNRSVFYACITFVILFLSNFQAQ